MPTYAYACTECGHNFDVVQRFTDAALTECPRCSGRLRKRFTSVGVVFKGSGFYRTDNRKPEKPEKTASSADRTSDKSSEKSSEKSSSDKQPAAAAS